MDTKTLFVAGIPWAFDDKKLGELFAQHGTVISAKVIMNRDTQRSKGYGFVEMSTAEEAGNAIKKLNDFDLNGRKLVVNMAKPREVR